MKKFLIGFISCIVLLLSGLAEGQSEAPTAEGADTRSAKVRTKTRIKKDYRQPSGIGSDGFVGLQLGIASSEPELGKSEPDRSGYQIGVRGAWTIFSGSFGVSGGLGWFYNSLSTTIEKLDFQSLPEDDIRRQKTVTSSGAFVEFYPHFRPSPQLQLGPIAHVAFAPYRLYLPGEDNKPQTIFAGAMAAYALGQDENFFRLGAEYLFDINIETRSLQMIMLTLDFGFSMKDRFTKVVEKRRTEQRKEVIEKVVEKPVERKVVTKQITLVFDQQAINFVTAKAELIPSSQQKLERLARFLKDNRALWSRVIIEGHTDRRGELQYNMKLSMDRAIAVSQALMAHGVDRSVISWQGFGPTQPIDPQDNEIAWARNRRVEIKFDGVADEVALREGVAAAMK
jgi:outer membrane protein OmpA-like peptidoglycan-associated protein